MKKKLSTILTVLVIAMFAISTADAGQGIKLSAGFKLGSLIADGFLIGTDQTTVTVVLDAKGTCNNVDVEAFGEQVLFGNEENEESGTQNNNKRPFQVETNNPGNCNNKPGPNDNFVFWTHATISVYSGDITQCSLVRVCEGLLSSAITTSNPLLVQQDYNCRTNQDTHKVSCTPVKNPGSNNNGTVAICHATGNKKNPYVLLTVNVNGLNGHDKHSGDIIPAPADGCPN